MWEGNGRGILLETPFHNSLSHTRRPVAAKEWKTFSWPLVVGVPSETGLEIRLHSTIYRL